VAKAEARRINRKAEAKTERKRLVLEAEKKAAKEEARVLRMIAGENEKQKQGGNASCSGRMQRERKQRESMKRRGSVYLQNGRE